MLLCAARYFVDAGIIFLLVLCLWIPDSAKALGRVYVWDQFRNWDQFIMLPGWGHAQGLGLNTDIISSWGLGAVAWISGFARMLGGFDYPHVLTVMMGMVIIYYASFYVFLRVWLRSVLMPAALVAMAVKIQLFHAGISPLIWIFPQDTPLRHWLDLPVWWFFLRHAQSGRNKYLMWAAITTGVAIAWQLSTGLCLLLALWGYLIFLYMIPEYRGQIASNYDDLRRSLFYLFLPLAVMAATLFLLQGNAIFRYDFWANTFEPVRLFLRGVGTVSIFSCLYDRHFFAWITGFLIPVIYAWTLITITGAIYLKESRREDLFLVPLCIYGLSMYLHYLSRGSISHYYAVGLALVGVIGFWSSGLMARFNSRGRFAVSLLVCLGAWGALFTNIFFVYYPNIFDISRMDWDPETRMYESQFNFSQDAAMVARLTPEHQKAAVISSFEAKILMQAKRKPFFYDAPLVSSERLDVNGFAGTSVITQERLTKTVKQITENPPEYVFIEKRLLGQWPAELAQSYPGIILVLRDLVEHYKPVDQGMYLLALQRK